MRNPTTPRRLQPKSASPADIEAYEKAMIRLRILELGELQVQQGKVVPAAEAFRRVRDRLKKLKEIGGTCRPC
jgi:hypothetical protein